MKPAPENNDRAKGVLRLGYLVSRYPAVTHTFVLNEIRGLRRMGADIQVISISPPDRSVDAMTAEEANEHRATVYVRPQGPLAFLRDNAAVLLRRPLRYLGGLVHAAALGQMNPRKTAANLLHFAEGVMVGRWAERQGLSHLHVHFSSTVAYFATRVIDIGVSMTIHGPEEFFDPNGFYLERKVGASRFVVAISRYGASQLMLRSRRQDWTKIEVAPLGIDPDFYVDEGRTGARPRRRQILSVGRLAPVKGQHILLDAIARLIRKGHDVSLVLVGDGPGRDELRARLQRDNLEAHVTLAGALNLDELRELYRASDVFALPSFAEGVPVVLMEAMAMGLPCVATWVNGVPELIRNEIDGLLIAPADAEALSEAIERLLHDDDLCTRLGANGRARVLDKFNLHINVARLASVMQARLVQSPSPHETGP